MKWIKNIFSGLILLFVIILQYNCSDKPVYQSETEITGGIWSSNKAAEFKTDIADTLQLFDIRLSITNSNEYRYSNIWLFVKSYSPAGYIHIDTIDVLLAEEDGKWLGNHTGDWYTLDFDFKRQIRFPKIGVYTFEIIQGMRDKDLKGVHKVGFELLKAN